MRIPNIKKPHPGTHRKCADCEMNLLCLAGKQVIPGPPKEFRGITISWCRVCRAVYWLEAHTQVRCVLARSRSGAYPHVTECLVCSPTHRLRWAWGASLCYGAAAAERPLTVIEGVSHDDLFAYDQKRTGLSVRDRGRLRRERRAARRLREEERQHLDERESREAPAPTLRVSILDRWLHKQGE